MWKYACAVDNNRRKRSELSFLIGLWEFSRGILCRCAPFSARIVATGCASAVEGATDRAKTGRHLHIEWGKAINWIQDHEGEYVKQQSVK